MGEEIAFENGRISDFQGLVTLTLTLDRFILHTFMHHSSKISLRSETRFVDGRTDGRMDGRAGGWTFETHFIRSTRRSRPKNSKNGICVVAVTLLSCDTVMFCTLKSLWYFVAPWWYFILQVTLHAHVKLLIKFCHKYLGE